MTQTVQVRFGSSARNVACFDARHCHVDLSTDNLCPSRVYRLLAVPRELGLPGKNKTSKAAPGYHSLWVGRLIRSLLVMFDEGVLHHQKHNKEHPTMHMETCP